MNRLAVVGVKLGGDEKLKGEGVFGEDGTEREGGGRKRWKEKVMVIETIFRRDPQQWYNGGK